ncbi:iron chaperone [Cohnella cellulosilytica]|uniref:Iron chaperone n=1 Tax=Cohnella cellulosilytica TaxID=986710 RepID=A0ABW2FKL9_9BACL
MPTGDKVQSVEEYIGAFSAEVQTDLERIRQAIAQAIPNAEEVVSYQLPAFKLHGMVIYYSAYKSHYSISMPPPFTAFEAFKDELAPYDVSKSAIKFPMDKPLPLELIGRIAKFKAQENAEAAQKKKKK